MKVQIVEVGLRDGLQNESIILGPSTRLIFAHKLSDAGLKRIELGAFVHPHWIPQMAHSPLLIKKALLQKKEGRFPRGVQFSALVPNLVGLENAIKTKIKEISVFAACSESFSKNNINCTMKESIEQYKPVVEIALQHKMKVRGYLSVAFGCPFEGKVPEFQVLRMAEKLFKLGVFELSIGDTIGAAHPKQVKSLMEKLAKEFSPGKIAGHFHDTRGQALANILTSLDQGIRVFDTSIGGLGGCPYAPGASGNVATEDVIYMLNGLGYKTGINLAKLIHLNKWVLSHIGHPLPSRVGKAGLL